MASGIRALLAVALVAVSAACASAQPLRDASAPTHRSTAGQAAHVTSGRSYPVIYLGGMAGEWAGPSVRPPYLDLGADWTINGLRWSDWGQAGTAGHGNYDACAGAGGPCDRFQAAITVTDVRTHDGRRYFATMKITGKGQQTEWLFITRFGVWQQR